MLADLEKMKREEENNKVRAARLEEGHTGQGCLTPEIPILLALPSKSDRSLVLEKETKHPTYPNNM